MNKNYTQGPWKRDGYKITDSDGYELFRPLLIHGYLGPQMMDIENANCRLVIAAPDLVEALEAQIKETQRLYQLTKDIEYKGKASAIEMYDCIVDEATAALTKAGVLTKDK